MFDIFIIILCGLIWAMWLGQDDIEIEILKRRQADIKARAKQILEENNNREKNNER